MSVGSTSNNNPPKLSSPQLAAVERRGPSPLDLARMAAEEDWKRKLFGGGGGGGSPEMKSPTAFVLHSLSIIGQKMRELYESVIAAFEASQGRAPEQIVTNEALATEPATNNPLRFLAKPTMDFLQTNIRDLIRASQDMLKQSLKISNSLSISIAVIVNRLVKLLGFAQEAEEEVFEDDEDRRLRKDMSKAPEIIEASQELDSGATR